MTYTLTTAPQNGQFELTTNPGSAITSFTQAEINAGSVVYVHNGSNTNSDAIAFTISDGANGTITGQTFNITVHDNPIVEQAIRPLLLREALLLRSAQRSL